MMAHRDFQGWLLLIALPKKGSMLVASPWRLPGFYERSIGSFDLIFSPFPKATKSTKDAYFSIVHPLRTLKIFLFFK